MSRSPLGTGLAQRSVAQHTRQLELCTYCPKLCRHVCPVSNATGVETLIPQAKMQLLNMLRRDAAQWTNEFAAPLYGCTGCRLCQQYCKHDNDVASVLMDGRAMAVERGLQHPALDGLPQRFRRRNERLRAKLLEHVPPHRLAKEARVGYLPGCDTVDYSIGDIDDAFTVFESLGIDFVKVVDGPTLCAGYPLWVGGHPDAGRLVAEELLRHLERFATVIVGCPACAYLLRERLPAEGLQHEIEIVHLSEFLFVHAERLPIKRRRQHAYYHDPCYLGRYLRVYEPPRRLVERCVESPREFFHAREQSQCCGGGGLVPLSFPEAARRQATERLREPQLFGVDLVVTSCPTCKRILGAAGSDIEVLDLVNLIAWSLTDAPD